MNVQDRKLFDDLTSKLDSLDIKVEKSDKNNIKLYHRIDKILMKLEDDPNSTDEGLITKVNKIEQDLASIKALNVMIKRASIFLFSIAGAVITFVIKNFFKPE